MDHSQNQIIFAMIEPTGVNHEQAERCQHKGERKRFGEHAPGQMAEIAKEADATKYDEYSPFQQHTDKHQTDIDQTIDQFRQFGV